MDIRAHRGIAGIGALGALILLLMIARASGDPPEVTVGFSPQHAYITTAPGAVVVQVTVDSAATDLKGFSFAIDFDETFITPVSVLPGSLLTNAGCDYFFEWRNDGNPIWEPGIGDSVAVDGALLGDCSVAGPGSLFEVVFYWPGVPVSLTELGCRPGGRLRNSANDSLFYTCEPGTVSVLAIPVENRSWGRIKAGYR